MAPLVFDSSYASLDNALTFGMDGVFPISTRNCALAALTGIPGESPYLKPGCNISFSLHKRNPFSACVELANVTDATYFSDQDCGAQALTVLYEITSITLAYESTIVDSDDQLASLKRSERQYYVDCPLMRLLSCQHGVKYDSRIVSLPKNTKMVYLFWIYQDQFILNVNLHSYLSARFRFPPNLVDCVLSLPGKDGLVMVDGMKSLGVNTAWNSASMRAYHSRLVKLGLYDKDFDSFSPNRKEENISYDQVLLFPLKDHNIEEATQLNVVMRYNDNLSQQRWYLNAFCIVQKILSCDSKHQWEWKDVSDSVVLGAGPSS
jgi:hypothetical protein